MSDNAALLDIELQFAGQSWKLRPSFKKIISVEATLNQPSRQLGLKCLNYEASVSEIAALLYVILNDQAGAPDREKIGDVLMEDGYDQVMVPLGQFLCRAIRGNKIHEREAAAKAAGTNPPQKAPTAGG